MDNKVLETLLESKETLDENVHDKALKELAKSMQKALAYFDFKYGLQDIIKNAKVAFRGESWSYLGKSKNTNQMSKLGIEVSTQFKMNIDAETWEVKLSGDKKSNFNKTLKWKDGKWTIK